MSVTEVEKVTEIEGVTDVEEVTGVEEVLKSTLGLQQLNFIEKKCGFINEGRVYNTESDQKIFVKLNQKAGARQMFLGEIASIQEIAKTGVCRVPNPIQIADLPGSGAMLVMDYVEMEEINSAQRTLGRQLAEMHLANQENIRRWHRKENIVGTSSKLGRPVQQFGFYINTCCGFLPQYTQWEQDWTIFYTRKLDNRISNIIHQYGDREVNELWNLIVRAIPKLFHDVKVIPSLLHGDLWRGNTGQTQQKQPGESYANGSGKAAAYQNIINLCTELTPLGEKRVP